MPAGPRTPATTTGIDPPVALPSVQAYFPAKVGTPHCVIFNSGASPAFLGGSGVTASLGLYFPPGAQLSLPYAPFAIWAVDGGIVLGTVTTTLTANVPAGATSFVVAGTASIVAGTWLQLGNANAVTSQETVIVSSVVAGTAAPLGTVTTSTATQFDHISAGTVAIIASQAATSLSVNAGVT